jgi:hypothetical protein
MTPATPQKIGSADYKMHPIVTSIPVNIDVIIV